MSQALNLLSNISGLEGIKSSDDYRVGAHGEQDDGNEPTSFLWQTVPLAITENLLFFPRNFDRRTERLDILSISN